MTRRWAPLAAAVSVVAVAVAVSLVVGRSPSGDPPVLRLASGSGVDAGVAADAPLAAGTKSAGGASFQLVGPLPSGPDEARAHPLPRGAAKADDVRRLADALGIKDAPKRVAGGWQAGALRVRDDAGNPWFMYAGCAPDVPVSSSDGVTSICASGSGTVGPGAVSGGSGSSGSGSAPAAGSGGTADSGPATETGSSAAPNSTDVAPPPPALAPAMSPCPANARCPKPPVAILPPLPTLPSPGPTADVEAARHAAKLVLADLGLADADVTVQGGGEHAYVQAAPRVSGLRTSGYDTSLEIDADGQVVGGNGYLGRPTDGATYPLVTAKAAFDALPELPRPMYACAIATSCPQPAPAKVTGAELGLMLTPLADLQAALLPAWLFSIQDWPMPLPQAAIEPRFLSLPKPVQIDPVPPAAPPGQPAEPPVPPSASRGSFGFDAAFPTDDPNALIVQYGDSGSCPHTDVTHQVKESSDSVVVFLEGDTQSTKQVCTDDYRQMLITLSLQAPLGDRKVIDGSRGEPVPVDRTCARPMGQPAPPKSCKG